MGTLAIHKRKSYLKFHQANEQVLFFIVLKCTCYFCHFAWLCLKGQRLWTCKGKITLLHYFSCSNSLFKGKDQALPHRVSFPSHLPRPPLRLLLTPLSWDMKLKKKTSCSFLLLQLAVLVKVLVVCIWVIYLFQISCPS